MKLNPPQFSLVGLLWFITGVAMLLGAYTLGRRHGDALAYQQGYDKGVQEIRLGELADMTTERDTLKDERDQLRDYNAKLVESKFKEWREGAKK